MVHLSGIPRFSIVLKENISETSPSELQQRQRSVNGSGRSGEGEPSGACSFVVADWRAGAEPFCGAPTRTGSSYCAAHEPLCVARPGSPEERALEAALAEAAEAVPAPPPELAHLAESALPDPSPDDPADLRVLLDHQPPDRRSSEGE